MANATNPDDGYLIFRASVPQQMDANATEVQTLLSAAAAAKKAVTASFISTFVLQFFLKGAMKMIWPLYGTLQIISVYLLFTQVKVPSNCITLAE